MPENLTGKNLILPTDECVVLKSMSYREADRIVTVFSKNFGKKNLLARGACKPNSKLGGCTDSLSIIEYIPKPTRTFTLITEPRIITPLFKIKESGDSFFMACAVCEIILRATEFDVKMSGLYDVFKNTLIIMNSIEKSEEQPSPELLLLLKFELFFLDRVGYQINMNNCSSCGRVLSAYIYDLSSGGNVCERCSIGRTAAVAADYEMALIKKLAAAGNVSEMLKYRESEPVLLKIQKIIKSHLKANLHVTLTSDSFF
ncbi:MAG: DNA repair protein RecO [Candidatus Wallbacteria bacterium]